MPLTQSEEKILKSIKVPSENDPDNPEFPAAVFSPAGGDITIIKNTVGGNGTFNYTTSNATTTPFSITTIGNTGAKAFIDAAAGTYVITETGINRAFFQFI